MIKLASKKASDKECSIKGTIVAAKKRKHIWKKSADVSLQKQGKPSHKPLKESFQSTKEIEMFVE